MILVYVRDEVKKTLKAYAKYHDVSVSVAGAELLMQGAMNWISSEDTQRYKNQPVNPVNAEMQNTEYVTCGEFTAMMASMCTQVGITLGEIRGTAMVIEETVNEAKKIQQSHENRLKAGCDSEDTTNARGQQSKVKLG